MDQELIWLNFQLTKEQKGKLVDLANADSRTMSSWLRKQIDDAYDRLIADGHKETQAVTQ